MRRASLVVLATLAVALLAGCGGGSGDRTASVGDATITIPSDVHGVKDELTALLEQFPYQHWYTTCVEKRFEAGGELKKGKSLDMILAKAGAACEKSSGRPLIDPNATSAELDLLRAEVVPTMQSLAESNHLDSTQSECLTKAFEKLPDKYIVQFGNGDQKTRGDILLTVFKTCAEAG